MASATRSSSSAICRLWRRPASRRLSSARPGCIGFSPPESLTRFVDAPPDESFDAQIAISSLPRAFRTRLDTVPADSPYLSAEPALVEKWSQRIGSAGFKIGVVWQGNPHPEADRARSMPLVAFAPLARIAGVRLISLQKGFGEEQLRDLPPDHAGRNARPGLRRRPRRLRRRRGGDDASRPHRHLRHVDRASGRRTGAAGMGGAEERRGMAMDDGKARFPLVPDHATVPPVATRSLGRAVREHGPGAWRARSPGVLRG